MAEWIMKEETDMDGVGCYIRKGELIRCKECIHYSYDPEFRSYECSHKKGLMECDPDSWCSYAEEIQK